MKTAVLALIFMVNAMAQVVITDSGSTNRRGMTVTLGDKGHSAIAESKGEKVKMSVPGDVHKKLMQDLEAAGPLDQLQVSHCAKSVSFGSSMYVTYKGVRSPDISCGGQTDPTVIELKKDADEIMAQAHAKMPSSRFR